MDKPHRVYVDDTHFITYPHQHSIKIIGAGIGVLKYPVNVAQPILDYVSYVGVARNGRIRKRELDVLGMLVADGLVSMSRPKNEVVSINKYQIASMYHFCGGIDGYVRPYLVNHAWREEGKNDRNARRIISNRIDAPVDRNTTARLNYSRKQTMGNFATREILDNLVIPGSVLDEMFKNPDKILNIKTLRFVKPESFPPVGWSHKAASD